MKIVVLVALFLVTNNLFVIKAENDRIISRELLFDDRKLHRVIPKSEEDLTFLNNLRSSNFGIIFWNGIGKIEEPVDLLTTPALIEEMRQKYPNVNLEITETYSQVTISMSQNAEQTAAASECADVELLTVVNKESTVVPMNRINGTDLYTGVYYKVGMKKFPRGWVTWTSKRDPGEAYFWQIDLETDTLPMYETGGSHQNDNQWTFGETEYPGCYTLANRGVPKGFATYSNSKVSSGSGYHLIVSSTPTDLARLSPGGEWRIYAFWMPVATNENNFYQLVIKYLPEGKITWSGTKYGNNSHYIMVATRESDMSYYQPGNKWYDDTLFRIELGSQLILEGTVYDFKFYGTLENILQQNNIQVNNISTVDQFNIPNRSSVSERLEIEETIIERSKDYTIQFEEDFLDFISKTDTDLLHEIGCKELKCEKGGLCTKTTDRSINIKTKINIPKNSKSVVSVQTEWVNAVEMPFIAEMKIVGKTDRILADGSGNVQFGTVPGDFIECFLKSKAKKVETVRSEEDALVVKVSGTLSGIFPMKAFLTPQFT